MPRRVHVVVQGDNLAGIAYAEYGNAAHWRAIAIANSIDDPMRLRPGTRLLLPTADEAGNVASETTPTALREVTRAR